jgi:Mg-chelatase subunit ChlI
VSRRKLADRRIPSTMPSSRSPCRRSGVPGVEPEQAAKLAVARRARPSAVPGHVKLTLTLDVPRALAEWPSAKAIREGKNLEALVAEILASAEK